VRAHANAWGVVAVIPDEVYAADDVLKVHPTRLNAFASTQTGPLAALVENRVVPLTLPVRDAVVVAVQVPTIERIPPCVSSRQLQAR
jgi:L-asparaginase